MLRLTIKEPCHERWGEMTPVEKGAYCNSCCKQVTDFSLMSDNEIISYFEKRKDEPICGRFRNDQLNRPVVYISQDVLLMDIPLWKKFLAAVFICFSVFMTGCASKKDRLDKLDLDNLQPVVTSTINTQSNAVLSLPNMTSSNNTHHDDRGEIDYK